GTPARLAAGSRAALLSALALAVQHFQLGVEALQHAFSAVSVIALLVGPFPRLPLPGDIDLAAFRQVLLSDTGQSAPDGHGNPLGLFALLAVAVFPTLRDGDAQVRDLFTALGVPDFGVGAKIADEFAAVQGHQAASFSVS